MFLKTAFLYGIQIKKTMVAEGKLFMIPIKRLIRNFHIRNMQELHCKTIKLY